MNQLVEALKNVVIDWYSLKILHFKLVLDKHNGNRTHAAKELGMPVRTVRKNIHDYDYVDKPKERKIL